MKKQLIAIYKKSPIPIIRGKIIKNKYYSKDVNDLKCELTKLTEKNIFYFGVPRHNNLGDLAQFVCIKEFLKRNYSEYSIIEVPSAVYINNVCDIQNKVDKSINENDLIFFQSGYCTHDMGGCEDEVHKCVANKFPGNKLVLLPQTILFKSNERKEQTSTILNSHEKLLFLARDEVSFQTANEMFPDRKVLKYPDIVTTLIGKYNFNNERSGVMVCVRNDSEKLYSDEEIKQLIDKLSVDHKVTKDDTTIKEKVDSSTPNIKQIIESYIEKLSKYEVVITDRYHGTIFSLIANTPVIVIKSNDHKVVTGVDWFKGIYDGSVMHEPDINKVPQLVNELINSNLTIDNKPYFEGEYYDKLKDIINGL